MACMLWVKRAWLRAVPGQLTLKDRQKEVRQAEAEHACMAPNTWSYPQSLTLPPPTQAVAQLKLSAPQNCQDCKKNCPKETAKETTPRQLQNKLTQN